MNRYLLFIALLINFSLFFFSCQKKKEEKITGNWQYIYLTNTNNTIQNWTFIDNNKFIKTIKTDTIISDTADWKLTADALSATKLKITGINEWTDGTYEILTLNKKYLIIQRISLSSGSSDGAFNRMEFVKSN
jgi:hypothetical protein